MRISTISTSKTTLHAPTPAIQTTSPRTRFGIHREVYSVGVVGIKEEDELNLRQLFRREPKVSDDYVRYNAIARLYEYRAQYFVCSVRWIAETESMTTLPLEVDDLQLGEAVILHLKEFDPTEQNLRHEKRSDWAAFKASRAKSMRQFEAELWHVNLAIMNSVVLVNAHPRIQSGKAVEAYVCASKNVPHEVGRSVRNAIEAAKVLKKLGMA